MSAFALPVVVWRGSTAPDAPLAASSSSSVERIGVGARRFIASRSRRRRAMPGVLP